MIKACICKLSTMLRYERIVPQALSVCGMKERTDDALTR